MSSIGFAYVVNHGVDMSRVQLYTTYDVHYNYYTTLPILLIFFHFNTTDRRNSFFIQAILPPPFLREDKIFQVKPS